jgi:hypothetical protein
MEKGVHEGNPPSAGWSGRARLGLEGAVLAQDQGLAAPGGQGSDSGQAGHPDGSGAQGDRPVAQRALLVGVPGQGSAIREQCQGVRGATGDGADTGAGGVLGVLGASHAPMRL